MEGLRFIRRSKNWCLDKLLFECLECNITLRSPRIFDILLEEVRQRLGNFGEVLHESSMLACKTEKASKLLDILKRLPFDNRFNFFRIYLDDLDRDDVAEIEYLLEPKFTFGELCIKPVLSDWSITKRRCSAHSSSVSEKIRISSR